MRTWAQQQLSNPLDVIETPTDFAQLASDKYMLPRHVQLINKHLAKLATGEITRLMICMPPRHGKSELVSKYFPAWYLLHNPDDRVILTSYNTDFAVDRAALVRDLMKEWGPTFGLQLKPDSTAANRWNIQKLDGTSLEGGMNAAGAGSSLTGRGGDLIIIDDPIKNQQDARSQAARDNVWNWYRSTVYTRLSPTGKVVLIQTRWHEDDLAGRILEAAEGDGEDWTVLSLPAICEDEQEDPIGRKEGEVLWPEQYSLAAIEQVKKTQGSLWFSAMYQQRPSPDAGLLFQRDGIRYYEETDQSYLLKQHAGDPKVIKKFDCWRFTTIDLAASMRQTADYTVMSTWAVTRTNELILLEMFRKRIEGPNQMDILKSIVARLKPEYVSVESTAYQMTLIQYAKKAGMNVKELKADKDKYTRALEAAHKWQSGHIYLPANSAIVDVLIQELIEFPNSKHDDCVDTLAYACLEVQKKGSWHDAYGFVTCSKCGNKYFKKLTAGKCPNCLTPAE